MKNEIINALCQSAGVVIQFAHYDSCMFAVRTSVQAHEM